MAGFVIVLALLLICVLAPFLGRDSRIQNEHDRRGWWPAGRSPR